MWSTDEEEEDSGEEEESEEERSDDKSGKSLLQRNTDNASSAGSDDGSAKGKRRKRSGDDEIRQSNSDTGGDLTDGDNDSGKDDVEGNSQDADGTGDEEFSFIEDKSKLRMDYDVRYKSPMFYGYTLFTTEEEDFEETNALEEAMRNDEVIEDRKKWRWRKLLAKLTKN